MPCYNRVQVPRSVLNSTRRSHPLSRAARCRLNVPGEYPGVALAPTYHTRKRELHMLLTTSNTAHMQTLITQARAALHGGDTSTARTLLMQATQLDPQSEQAWFWLSGVSKTE